MKKYKDHIKAIQKLLKKALQGIRGSSADKTDVITKPKTPIKSYQFMINEPISNSPKKNPDVKEMLKKRGLSSDPEWTISPFNHIIEKDREEDDEK